MEVQFEEFETDLKGLGSVMMIRGSLSVPGGELTFMVRTRRWGYETYDKHDTSS